jgi:exopolysaccharide biosynthesis polyprenyl glycosylphosphotransferase
VNPGVSALEERLAAVPRPLVPAGAWVVGVGLLDGILGTLAARLGLLVQLHRVPGQPVAIGTGALMALFAPVWVGALGLGGAYHRHLVHVEAEEARRVVNAAVWLLAGIGFASFALHADLSRGTVAVSLPLATGLTLAGRWSARRALNGWLPRGGPMHRAVVVGAEDDAARVGRRLLRSGRSGFAVVGTYTPLHRAPGAPREGGRALVTVTADILATARHLGADTVVVAGGALADDELRRLSWALEGSGTRLLTAPLTDLLGGRVISLRVEGLSLLEIEEPAFTGARRLVKAALDRSIGLLLVVLLAPLLAAIAGVIRLSDGGPALFRQVRLGLHGEEFTIHKFRTMRVGADCEYRRLVEAGGGGGVLFKLTADPRVTLVGRFLRRSSLDELPQLWDVVSGSMSLVGPRPQRAEEVARYHPDAHRRLLVKPGMTGLWQVSGRSQLSWEEALQLDLHYIENWSLRLDLVLLWRTVAVVLGARGAY